ncbi:MAG: hypothetical protein Q9214_006864, partial [Letrouitia sp. 1 TL-2023]
MGWDSAPVVSSRRYPLDLLTQPLNQETVERLEANGFGPIRGQNTVGGPAAAPEPQGRNTVEDLATEQRSIPVSDQSLIDGPTTVRDLVPAASQHPVGGPAGFGGSVPAAGRYPQLASSVAPNMAPYENEPQPYSQLQDPATRGCA